jgi:hypothetical protein
MTEAEEDLAALTAVAAVAAGAIVAVSSATQAILDSLPNSPWGDESEEQVQVHEVYRYRAPLPVPLSQEFTLDSLSEVWCLEFFRFVLKSQALHCKLEIN